MSSYARLSVSESTRAADRLLRGTAGRSRPAVIAIAPVFLLDSDRYGRHLRDPNPEPRAVVLPQFVGIREVAQAELVESVLSGRPLHNAGPSSAQQIDGDKALADRLHPPDTLTIDRSPMLDPVATHSPRLAIPGLIRHQKALHPDCCALQPLATAMR